MDDLDRRLRPLVDRAFHGAPKLGAEILEAVAAIAGDRNHAFVHALLEFLQVLGRIGQVEFVGHDHARLAGENLGVETQFALKDLEVIPWLAVLAASHVDDEDKQRAPLDVAKELVAKTAVVMGALDEARDIGHHDAVETVRVLDHADIHVQRGEGVRGGLRARRRKQGGQGRLTGIGVAHQPDVGDGLEHEAEVALLPRVARGGAARRLVDRALEIHVTEAALATGEEDHAVAVLGELGHEAAGAFLEYLGTGRHGHDEVRTIGARALAAHPGGAIAGGAVGLPAVGLEVALITVAQEHDVAALAAIAAIGATLGDELLATEADAPVPAVAGLEDDLGFVDEHGPMVSPCGAGVEQERRRTSALQPARPAQPALDRGEEDQVRQQADPDHDQHDADDLIHPQQLATGVQQ